jgi:transposase
MEQKKKKKRFNQEFKNSAVRLVEGGKSASQVARELDLPDWQVQTWVRESKKRKSATVGDVNLLEELKRLKKENARLQEEADILKKAAKYFAQNQP